MRRVTPRLLAAIALVAGFLVAHVGVAVAHGTFVQKRSSRVASGDRVAAAFKRPTAAGNLIVAYVVRDDGGSVSVTDTRGNSYASAVGPTQLPGDTASAQLFYARDIAGGATAVTATFTSAITGRAALYVHEYAGIDRVTPLDAATAASGSSTPMAGGVLATSTANALVFMAADSDGRRVRRPAPGYKRRARRYGSMTADMVAPTPGAYTATARHNGDAWTMQLAAFKPAGSTPDPPPDPPPPSHPLQVSANGRYLVDRHGVPFLIMGDSPQSLMVNLSEAQASAFFANRSAAGFNVVWINLLCATDTGGRDDASTFDGIVPFTTPGDLATPNEDYFGRVDRIIGLAAEHEITVVLDPAETKNFLGVLRANGIAKARDYGRYLGTRYRSFDNILWMHGNDFQTWEDPADDAVVQAVARGIQDTDERHLHTVELDFLVSGSLDDPSWAPLIDLNASYTYYPTYAQVLADYNRPNALPVFLVEANYEFERNVDDAGTPAILRRQAYWAMLSGAAGHLYGNRYTWPFLDGWESRLDTPGSRHMTLVQSLFAPRRWYDLVPDQTHTVVTAGYGTFADRGTLGDNDYLTAARTPDGALVMAYMPTRRTITVDMSTLAGPALAWWYDPTSAVFTAIPGSPLSNGGAREFTPPGDNEAGDGDWVLLLEAGH